MIILILSLLHREYIKHSSVAFSLRTAHLENLNCRWRRSCITLNVGSLETIANSGSNSTTLAVTQISNFEILAYFEV